jgi:hypothetical protein
MNVLTQVVCNQILDVFQYVQRLEIFFLKVNKESKSYIKPVLEAMAFVSASSDKAQSLPDIPAATTRSRILLPTPQIYPKSGNQIILFILRKG